MKVWNTWRHSICLFWQRAFNAAMVVNHLKKLHSSQSDPSLSSSSLPGVTVQSSSQRDHKTLGFSKDEAEDLDPNGNPLPDSGHLSCGIPGSGENVCQLLRVHPNKTGVLVTADGWEFWFTRAVQQEDRQKLHLHNSGIYYVSWVQILNSSGELWCFPFCSDGSALFMDHMSRAGLIQTLPES